jgi:hypothetical protein
MIRGLEMVFEFHKVSNFGTTHPVVARLGIQSNDLVGFINVDELRRDAIKKFYFDLMQRLLRCHEIRDGLMNGIREEVEKVTKQEHQIREVPQVVGLQGVVEGFLYETKNFLRDLLGLFEIVFVQKFEDASAFADFKGKGDSKVVKWAVKTVGKDDRLAQRLKSQQAWMSEVIGMRNAVEHPGGYSGSLVVHNIRRHPARRGAFISPTWRRVAGREADIGSDMDSILANLLTVAEDLLAEMVTHRPCSPHIAVYEIPIQDRNPQSPVRLRIGLNQELLGKS